MLEFQFLSRPQKPTNHPALPATALAQIVVKCAKAHAVVDAVLACCR
jgi:hypothetical protein